MAQIAHSKISQNLYKKLIAIRPYTSTFSTSLTPKAQKFFSKIPDHWKTLPFLQSFQAILVQSISEKHKLNDCDALFISSMIHLESQSSGQTTQSLTSNLAPIFNGFTAPMGDAFIKKFVESSLKPEDINSISLSRFKKEKEIYAPFEVTLIFPTIKLVIRSELLNLIPRPEIRSGEATLHRIRAEILDWAKDKGFTLEQVETIEKGDFAQLAWRALPNLGPDKYNEIFMYSKFLTLLFFHDDIGDNQESVLSGRSKLQEISLRNRDLETIFNAKSKDEVFVHFRENTDPIIQSAIEIVDFLLEIANEVSLEGRHINMGYVHREIKNYLETTSDESKAVKENTRVNESTYLSDIRPFTSSLYACYAISAMLQRISIANDLLTIPKIRSLTFIGNELVSLPNDVISFPMQIDQRAFSLIQIKLIEKAIDQGLISANAVFVSQDVIATIMLERPDLVQESIKEVIRQTNTSMRSFSELLLSTPGSGKKFIDEVVKPWIPANGDWQNKSERYVRKLGLEGPLQDCIESLKTTHGFTIIQME